MWKFLEQEKELIINELDLLSFLLVTPELFRFVGPAIGAVGYSVMFALLGVLFIGGPASLYIIFHPSPNSPWMLVFLFLFLLFSTNNFIRTTSWFVKKALEKENLFFQHAFLIGVLLFLISRGLAFSIAIHQQVWTANLTASQARTLLQAF